MKLNKPLILIPPKYRNEKCELITPDVILLEELNVLHISNPKEKTYYLSIQHLPGSILLFSGDTYNDKITVKQAEEVFKKVVKDDIQSFLQKTFPRTLENEPNNIGSLLLKKLGIVTTQFDPLYEICLKMNIEGLEWTEKNIDKIANKVKQALKNHFFLSWWMVPVKSRIRWAIKRYKKIQK